MEPLMNSQFNSTQEQLANSLTNQLKEVSDALLEFSPSRTQAEQLREQLSDLLNRLEQCRANHIQDLER
jgi:uncharacterized coiled-coil protein SlyX